MIDATADCAKGAVVDTEGECDLRHQSSLTSEPVVVHLVHGTWPYGLWRGRYPKGDYWFHPRSSFREAIVKAAGVPVQFCVHLWSGRNSFPARKQIADKICHAIQAWEEQEPGRKHLIIAHSHGGTAAVYAAQSLSRQSIPPINIAAVICMASPFVYYRPLGRQEGQSARWAPAALLTALGLIAAWHIYPPLREISGWLIVLMGLLMMLLLGAIFEFSAKANDPDGYLGQSDRRTPILIVRATRDEASMAIGLAHTINAIGRFFYFNYDNSTQGLRPLGLLRWIMISIPFLLAALVIVDHLFIGEFRPKMETQRFAFVLFLTGAGTATAFLTSQFLMCLATGYWKFRTLLSGLIEIDSLPPLSACTAKCYADWENEQQGKGLRHGIHAVTEVRNDIGFLIARVSAGRRPRFP